MPLPPGAHAGQLADGTLVWLDANNQPINADGTPMATTQTVKPLTPAPNTAPVAPPAVTSPLIPGGGIQVPGATAATPAPAITSSATPQVGAGGVQVPAAGNIDANAGAQPSAPPATPAQTAQGSATAAGQAPPTAPAPNAQGMYAPDDATKQAASVVQQANLNVASAYAEIQKQQQAVDDASTTSVANPQKLASAQQALSAAYSQLSQAEDSLSVANTTYATSLGKFTDPQALAQADQARAAAKEADARIALLTDDTPGGQRALNAAQAGLASANAASAEATAQATKLKAGPEADALTQQAAQSKAQANQINALIGTPDNPGPLIRKANEEVNTQVATTSQVQSQTTLNNATATRQTADANLSQANADYQKALLAAGGPQATVAQAQGAAAQSQATAQSLAEATKAKQQGALYGIPQQIDLVNQIAKQVFGPGGTGNPDHADQLLSTALSQVVPATIAGTTPYAGAVAAQNANQNQFQTQAAMWNQSSQSAAARANAFAGTAGSALGSMLQANQWMPKGSTAMGDAFQYFLDQMKGNMGGPQAFMPGAQPTPPPMPALLQGFAAGHAAGTAQAQQANPPAQAPGQAAPTVNINVNGQPSGSSGPPTPPPPPASAPWTPPGGSNYTNPGPAPWNATPASVAAGNAGIGAASQSQQSPADAFAQGLANNQPAPLPNYLSSLVDPMSMLRSGRGLASLYNQGPGLGAPTAGSLLY